MFTISGLVRVLSGFGFIWDCLGLFGFATTRFVGAENGEVCLGAKMKGVESTCAIVYALHISWLWGALCVQLSVII